MYKIRGPLPAEIGNLTSLRSLELGETPFFDGPIPSEIGNLINLESLSITDTSISGPIPQEIKKLVNLKEFIIGASPISGTFPLELSELENLTTLVIGDTDINGTIPHELSNLKNLTELIIAGNKLSGKVPYSVAELVSTLDPENCHFGIGDNYPTSLCIPNTYAYSQLGVDPICGLPLSANCGFSWPTFMPAILGRLNHIECETTAYAGSNKSEKFIVEIGNSQGAFDLSYQAYTAKDQIVIKYEDNVIYDTGCVGGKETVSVNYSGNSSEVTVEVFPNCDGTSSTKWNFTVGCPE